MKPFLIGLFVILFFSCQPGDRTTYLPGYSGQVGELVVVIDNNFWNGIAGDSIIKTLAQYQYGLPQDEPTFTLVQVPQNTFNKVLKTHRNVLLCLISDTVLAPKLTFKKNKLAKMQMLVEIKAPNINAFLALLSKNANNIISLFNRAEINRLYARNLELGDNHFRKSVFEKTGLNIAFQKDFALKAEKENFWWYALERERPIGGYQHQISQNFIIAKMPYTNRTQFLNKNLQAIRDSIAKKYLLGPTGNAYIQTETKHLQPQFIEIDFNGQYAKEFRGLWYMEHNFMGGPFYAMATLMPNENEILYVEGFVFAPQFDKREFLRELEVMARTITFEQKP